MDANDVTKLVDAEWAKFERTQSELYEAQRQYRANVRASFRKAMELVARPNLAASARDSLDAIAWKVSTLFPAEPQSGETLEAPVIRLLTRLWAKEQAPGLVERREETQVEKLRAFLTARLADQRVQHTYTADQVAERAIQVIQNLSTSVKSSNDALHDRNSAFATIEAALVKYFPDERQKGSVEAAVVRVLEWASRMEASKPVALPGTDAGAMAQIDVLARFILNEIPGEPSQNEGAVDTAIRLLRRYADQVRVLTALLRSYENQVQALNAEREQAAHCGHSRAIEAIQSALAKYFPNVNQPSLTVAGKVERALQLGREGIDGHQKALNQLDAIAAAALQYLPEGKYTDDKLVEAVKQVLRIDANNRETIRKYLAGEGLPVPELDSPIDALLDLAMNRKRTIETYERSGTFMQVEAANKRAAQAYENGFKDGQRREEERQRLMTEQAAASEVVKAHAHVDSNEPVAAPRPPMASKELMVQLTTDEDALIQANNQLERAKQAVEQARARLGKTVVEVARRLETAS